MPTIEPDQLLMLLRRQLETPLESTYAEVELSENIPFSREKEAYAAVKMTVKINGRIGVGADPTLAILALNHIAMTALGVMRQDWVIESGEDRSITLTAPADLMLTPELIFETQRSHPAELLKGTVISLEPASVQNWVRFNLEGSTQTAFLALADLSRLMGQQLTNEIKAILYDGDGVYPLSGIGITARRQMKGYYKVVDMFPVGVDNVLPE